MTSSFIEERRSRYAGFKTRELVVEGRDPTVLLLHGFGDTADAWRLVLDLLHDHGQAAVAVDLPGFGQADRLREGELLPQLDAFLGQVIRQHGADHPVVVAGNSLGAAAAVRAARNNDLPVAAVLALGVAGITWTPLTASVATAAAALKYLPAFLIPRRVHRAVMRRALSYLLYGERSAVDPQVVATFGDSVADIAAARRLLRLGAGFKAELARTRHHGGVNVPMTVIHGTSDRLVPVSASRILHAANPGSRLVVLSRIGHCPQLDAAGVVARHACELTRRNTDDKEIS
jgi:pimeloyl-ACP methyl ester carboxylesterase